MGKLTLVVGAGVGYVLGTRAGRERYEQIVRLVGRGQEQAAEGDGPDAGSPAPEGKSSGDSAAAADPAVPESAVEGVPEPGSDREKEGVPISPPPPVSTAGDTAKPA